jgi:hypothetical protein
LKIDWTFVYNADTGAIGSPKSREKLTIADQKMKNRVIPLPIKIIA